MVFLFIVLVLTLSSSFNLFGIARPDYFYYIQRDSESIVTGALVSQKLNVPFQESWPQGFISFRNEWNVPAFEQTYLILRSGEAVSPRVLEPNQIRRVDWVHPAFTPSFRVAVAPDPSFDQYVARTVMSGGSAHILESVIHADGETLLYLSPSSLSAEQILGQPLQFLDIPPDYQTLVFRPYKSQFGLQARVFSKSFQYFGLTVSFAQFLLCFLWAAVLGLLFLYYERIFPKGFAFCFLLGIFLSPSLTGFAKNLFWVCFTWVLPALLSSVFFFEKEKKKRSFLLSLLGLSFLVRFLCGYEYVTSVILLALAPFVFDGLMAKGQEHFWLRVRECSQIFVIALASFAIALCMHGSMRGESVWEGLVSIYQKDITRRTMGNPEDFLGLEQESLQVTPFQVVKQYILGLPSPFLGSISWKYFRYALFFALLSFPLRGRRYLQTLRSDLALWVAFLPVPLSWFILGKGHTWIHQHMNMILWYWGFVGVVLFSMWRSLKLVCKRMWLWMESLQVEEQAL
jgi:hypothetical protein